MKKLTTLFIALFAIGAYAQVEVDEKNENIDGTKSGFVVSIPYGTQKQIEKELKDELKDWKGKFSNKGFIFADDCKLKEMGKNSFDVFARVDENPEGGAYVSIAIDLGGAHLTSKHHNDQVKVIRACLQKFGINAAKNVVGEEVKTEEKITTRLHKVGTS